MYKAGHGGMKTCNPSTQEVEIGGSLGFNWLAFLGYLVRLWPLSKHIHKNMHMFTRTHNSSVSLATFFLLILGDGTLLVGVYLHMSNE